jgi:hypothetical protein
VAEGAEKERLKTIFYKLSRQNRKIIIGQEEALLFAQEGREMFSAGNNDEYKADSGKRQAMPVCK